MSMDWNDPRLTAFALGELEGEERQLMEDLVNKSEDARKYVDDVRRLAGDLGSELKGEAQPALSDSERARILKSRWKMPVWVYPAFGLTAAGIVAVLVVGPLQKQNVPVDPTVPAPAAPAEVAKVEKNPLPESKSSAPADKSNATVASQEQNLAMAEYQEISEGIGSGAPKADFSGTAMRANKGAYMKKQAPGAAFGGSLGSSLAQQESSESYSHIQELDFRRVSEEALSTFSIDVDTASYSNMRRFLNSGALPPKDSIRIEEMINYFRYSYAPPKDSRPFAVHVEQTTAPWNKGHKLVRIGLKGREIDLAKRPKSNLVFLFDVSGSMEDANKLPLLKQGFRELIDRLGDNDRVAIVVYAGAEGLVLEPTSDKTKMIKALESLSAGGSTNGGAGIELAYKTAQANFIPGGTNRVILATDGDFNVGVSSEGDLVRLIETKAKSKIFLSVLGFGTGNLKDSNMEKLANKGNGHYAYIDSVREAKKVLVEEIGGTLVTIAKDVKIQVEFNPKFAAAYRLVGYENRMLNKEDFNDDAKDAGEIGAGHTVTALYEIIPAGKEVPGPTVDGLKYQRGSAPVAADKSLVGEYDATELLTVKLRYKEPEGDVSSKFEVGVPNENRSFEQASSDTQWAAAVAEFGMILRDSKWKGDSQISHVLKIANGKGDEYRREFAELVKRAEGLMKNGR